MTNLLPRLEFLAQAALTSLRLRQRVSCPACASVETRIRARKHLVVQVRECTACALFFTNPIYSRSLFGSLYGNLYGAEGSTTRLPGERELRDLLAVSFRGTDKDAHKRLTRIAEIARGKRFLELGSSWGYLLHQAQDHGFEVSGVEICETRRRFGNERVGVPIAASLRELGNKQFDVLYSAHTLEHFTDLRGVLRALAKRVAPGGMLLLEVPHFDLEFSGREALKTVGAVHPLGFTSEFFARNLPEAGFAVCGFFDGWEEFPSRPRQCSSRENVLVLAERFPAGVRIAA